MSGHKIEHPMTNLRKALNDDDLESFIAEHEDDAPGDMDKVDAVLKRQGQENGSEADANKDD